MRRLYIYIALTCLGVVAAGSVAVLAQQGATVNPIVGSVWTYFGPTFGAGWGPPSGGTGGGGGANTPENFGALGDGLANDTAGVTSCITASTTGLPCYIRNSKTYLINDMTLPSNAKIEGDGTLKRRGGSTTANFLNCPNCSNVCIKGVTIDGNKAAQTVSADNLRFTNYKNICLIYAKVHSAKGFNGIVFDTSVDEAAATYSFIDGAFVHDNDASGILGVTAAYKLWVNNTTASHNGAYGAYFGPTSTVNNIDGTLKYITVSGGDYSYNVNAGLAAQGFVDAYVAGQPSFGPGIEPVFGAKFTNITASNNTYYGIVLQARESILADSVARENASGAYGAGVLGNGENIEIVNVVSLHNNGTQGLGLDMGCGIGVHVVGGNYSSNSYAGINAGCTSYSSIRGATITSNGNYGIYALAAEASGDGYGIPGYTQTFVIADNRITCPGSSAYGIIVDGGLGVEISRNYVAGCEQNQAILVSTNSASVKNNVVPKSGDPSYLNTSGTNYEVTAASGVLSIPAWADSVALYGVNSINSVKSREEVANGTGVYSVFITNGGTGYPQHPTATWSGCTVAPTGTAFANRSGKLTGYRFATVGSGCVNPTVSFSGGTGATSTAYMRPLSGSFQKELTLLVAGPYLSAPSTLTITSGGNIAMPSAITAAGTSSTVRLYWGYNAGVYELGRTLYP
jgi:hypothetical protein